MLSEKVENAVVSTEDHDSATAPVHSQLTWCQRRHSGLSTGAGDDAGLGYSLHNQHIIITMQSVSHIHTQVWLPFSQHRALTAL